MRRIAVASALMILLIPITANAGGCPNNHVGGLCAIAHHPVKHANKKHHNMSGAFTSAGDRGSAGPHICQTMSCSSDALDFSGGGHRCRCLES
jgi:hypothetical protein